MGHHYGLGLTQVNTVHFNGGGTGMLIRQAGPTAAQEMIWSYRGQLREQGLDAAGRPVFDASGTTARSPAGPKSVHMRVTGTGIDYRAKTWWHAALRLNLPGQRAARRLRQRLPSAAGGEHGRLARGNPHGTVLRALPHRRAAATRHGPCDQARLGETWADGPYWKTLWVSPATYLPMRGDLALARSARCRAGHADRRLPVAPPDRCQPGEPAGDGAARIPPGTLRRPAGPRYVLLAAGARTLPRDPPRSLDLTGPPAWAVSAAGGAGPGPRVLGVLGLAGGLAEASGRKVSIITAVSSVLVLPSARPSMTASTAPGCGPWVNPDGCSVIEPTSMPDPLRAE